MSHLDSGIIHELLDGEIPSSELAPIQAHLATCAECRARLDEERLLADDVAGLIDLLQVPPGEAAVATERPAATRWKPRPRDLAWAATVIIAAGLGYAAHSNPEPSPRESASAAAKTTAMVEPQPVTSPPTAEPATTPSPKDVAATPRAPAAAAREAPAALGAGAAAVEQRMVTGAAATRRVDSVAKTATPARPDTTLLSRVAIQAPGEVRNAAAAPPPAAGSGQALDATSERSARLDISLARSAGRGGQGKVDTISLANALQRPGQAKIDTISLTDAMRRLGGTLRLIDGMVPVRLELQEPYVRVVYPGDLVLRQQLIDGRVVFQLLARRGFPADSLALLRARVRE